VCHKIYYSVIIYQSTKALKMTKELLFFLIFAVLVNVADDYQTARVKTLT